MRYSIVPVPNFSSTASRIGILAQLTTNASKLQSMNVLIDMKLLNPAKTIIETTLRRRAQLANLNTQLRHGIWIPAVSIRSQLSATLLLGTRHILLRIATSP